VVVDVLAVAVQVDAGKPAYASAVLKSVFCFLHMSWMVLRPCPAHPGKPAAPPTIYKLLSPGSVFGFDRI
jgi:hypothetical protein